MLLFDRKELIKPSIAVNLKAVIILLPTPNEKMQTIVLPLEQFGKSGNTFTDVAKRNLTSTGKLILQLARRFY